MLKLNSDQALILKMIISGHTDDIKNFYSFENLVRDEFIAYTGAGFAYVTDAGLAALEEYEMTIHEKAVQEESVKIAKKSYRVSIFALIVSLTAIIVSVIISVYC